MGIAAGIVIDGFALDRFGGKLFGEVERALGARKNADFERAQGLAGIAIADFGEELQGVVVDVCSFVSQAALAVGQGAANDRF